MGAQVALIAAVVSLLVSTGVVFAGVFISWGRVTQKISGQSDRQDIHEEHDNERFQGVTDMLKEIRTDIKEILKRK